MFRKILLNPLIAGFLPAFLAPMVSFSAKMWKQTKMPAISTSFNRFLSLLCLQLALTATAYGELPGLSAPQMQWLGDRIFQNECGFRFDCLASWNQGEDFPSLGIGHFIWFRAGQTEPFEETFPALLAYYQRQDVALPDWISRLPEHDSPWQSRQQFYAESNAANMQELRQFLAGSTSLQVEFIAHRMRKSMPSMLIAAPSEQRHAIESTFYQISQTHPPYGIYALIDYVHFKGTGSNPSERYQGVGWGLLQVLQQMQNSPADLENFVESAQVVLARRVANAPVARRERRWLAGWKNRLRTYLPPALVN